MERKQRNLRTEFVWFDETKEQRNANAITSLSPNIFMAEKKLLDFKRERQGKRETEMGLWFSFSTFCFSLLISMVFFR